MNSVTPEMQRGPEEMPQRIIAYRSNVDGSIMTLPLRKDEDAGMDETLYIPASSLDTLRAERDEARNELKSVRTVLVAREQIDRDNGIVPVWNVRAQQRIATFLERTK